MRVAILTREYPPDVYGGAGVHVDFLVRELRRLVDVDVHCMGEPREGAIAHTEKEPRLGGANPALQVLLDRPGDDAPAPARPTWCTPTPGTPTWPATGEAALRRPARRDRALAWSRSGPGRPSSSAAATGSRSWAERTAYEAADAVIAVSKGMRRDVLAVLPGARPGQGARDPQRHRHRLLPPDPDTDVLERIGRRPRPAVRRVRRPDHPAEGRAAPAARRPGLRPVRCRSCCSPGAADTPELKAETDAAIAELRSSRDGVFVVSRCCRASEVRQVLTGALVFLCPSVYEPLGIVNLEAMACETAVVASDVGGIPEVVVDGETGLLVRLRRERPGRVRGAIAGGGEPARCRPRAGRAVRPGRAVSAPCSRSPGTRSLSRRWRCTSPWCPDPSLLSRNDSGRDRVGPESLRVFAPGRLAVIDLLSQTDLGDARPQSPVAVMGRQSSGRDRPVEVAL